MLLWGIDPGIRGCGKSIFRDGELIHASYVSNPCTRGNDLVAITQMAIALGSGTPAGGLRLVTERPQVYREVKLKGDPNDLLPLLGVTSALAMHLFAICKLHGMTEYLPRAWKGTVDPDVLTQRVRQRLSVVEFAQIEFPSNTCAECRQMTGARCRKTSCLAHNVYDSIGLGLKFLGRLEKKRVIVR